MNKLIIKYVICKIVNETITINYNTHKNIKLEEIESSNLYNEFDTEQEALDYLLNEKDFEYKWSNLTIVKKISFDNF